MAESEVKEMVTQYFFLLVYYTHNSIESDYHFTFVNMDYLPVY